MNKWARPLEWKEPAGRRSRPAAHRMQHYFAFLSYSHQDEEDADWLHRELERFQVPSALVGKLTEHGPVPRRLTPVFRDRHELAAADDLGEEIREALAHSRCLVVLCSPAAAKSKWTNAEIAAFKQLHPEGCIIAAVIGGEPLAGDIPGREDEECFPPALVAKYNRRGKPTGSKIEPLAADLREGKGGRRTGFLKVVAGMLGVGLDELVRREEVRKQRRLATITAGSVLGMLIFGGMAVTAIQGRDAARDQRREAEGLVAFMLGDLRDKLEPIGKLDALDGVGTRVLEYYSKQDASELSDDALLQRSRALNLTAEVALLRADFASAQRLYREAMDGTAEAIRRDPDDPQRLFDHAQNVFWTADISRQRGQLAEAEAGMREYKRLADRMVALEPSNMKWRMEQQSADTNLGVALFERRQFAEATAQFNRALQTMQALAVANPEDGDFQKSLTESQTWLASALAADGRLQDATRLREQHVAKINDLLRRTGDVEYRQKLVSAERNLGELHRFAGRVDEALEHFGAAVSNSETLLSREPANRRWSYFEARARIDLAESLLEARRSGESVAQATRACVTAQRLIATDPNVQRWRGVQRDCWLVRARIALDAGNSAEALRFAEQAVVAARSVSSTDPIEDKYAVAEAYGLLGDVRSRLGDSAGARAAWSAGLASVPPGVAEKPNEMAERVMVSKRLGRDADVEELATRLVRMGYPRSRFEQ